MKHLASLRTYMMHDRWYLTAGFAALIGVDMLQLMIPLVIKAAVDGLVGAACTHSSLMRHGLQIVAIGAAAAVLRFCWRYCIIGTSRRVEAALRDRLFSHVARLPLDGLQRVSSGDIMARMTNDIDSVRMCTGIGLVALVDTVVLGAASVIFMLALSPPLTLACLLPMLIIIFATWRLGGLLHGRFTLVQAAFSRLTEMVRETLSGIAVIRAFAREPDNARAFSAISSAYMDRNLELVKVWGFLFPFIMCVANASVCVLLFFGGRLAISGSVSPGDFVAFANYIWILIWPMMALGWIVNLFQRGEASMARINEVLALPAEPGDTGPGAAIPADGHIEIRDLSFSYGASARPAIAGIRLQAAPGSTIGITGTTASGKSTLCNLLLRFFDPPRGTIFLDGCDICDLPLRQLRSSIAYIPQDSFLFSDTILANILFGRPQAADDEAQSAAGTAQLTDEILALNKGFDTVVGEKGITLSGGQRQRVAIARALLMQAPVLIVDDALSSLDAETARALMESLKAHAGRQTRIIVSNRIASIRHADMIYVFDNAEIVSRGAHDELLACCGLYCQLYRRQQLEETEPDARSEQVVTHAR